MIVVGNGNVGKTSMTTRYAKGKYTGNYKKTIGVDFMEKSVELRDMSETVNLMIWDTAGQEEFDALTSRYYKGIQRLPSLPASKLPSNKLAIVPDRCWRRHLRVFYR